MVTVAEDAYSPNRKLELVYEQLELPSVLDRMINTVQAELNMQTDVQQVVDVAFYPSCGQTEQMDTGTRILLPGYFQTLYRDEAGELRNMLSSWEDVWNIQAAGESTINTRIASIGRTQALVGAGSVSLRADMTVEAVATAGQGLPMLTGMEMGEPEKPDANRPSLILCRKGNRKLWDVAKEYKSTVAAIMQANGLEVEPENGQVLLIPVK